MIRILFGHGCHNLNVSFLANVLEGLNIDNEQEFKAILGILMKVNDDSNVEIRHMNDADSACETPITKFIDCSESEIDGMSVEFELAEAALKQAMKWKGKQFFRTLRLWLGGDEWAVAAAKAVVDLL